MTRQESLAHAVCRCGERAVWFMDPDGDPLDHPMCNDCFAYWVTTEWEPEEDSDALSTL